MGEKDIIEDMRKKVKAYDQKQKAKEKEKERPVTIKDLERLLQKPTTPIAPGYPQQKPSSDFCGQCGSNLKQKEQVAFQLWKDSKATTIVCLIALIAFSGV